MQHAGFRPIIIKISFYLTKTAGNVNNTESLNLMTLPARIINSSFLKQLDVVFLLSA